MTVEELAVIKARCLNETNFFTRYMYRKETGKKFVVKMHHELIFEALDKVFQGEITRLIINIGPRLGKSEIAVKKAIARGFALNPSSKFMHLSYSDDLTMDNSQHIRDTVQSDYYQELFPDVKLKSDSNSKKKWYTTKGGVMYATSTGGQVTGFGAGETDTDEEDDWRLEKQKNFEKEIDEEIGNQFDEIFNEPVKRKFAGGLFIDDPIKPEDADNDLLRERINDRFDTTIMNRINAQTTPIVVIMQRLHENDLCGHLIKNHSEQNWTVLSIPALQTDEFGRDFSIWPKKIPLSYLYKERELRPHYFERQYMQSPKPKEGLMYQPFQTYDVLPVTRTAMRKNYTDVADKGKDYLCSICFVQTEIGYYVTDVLYTQGGTINTEPLMVSMLNRNKTTKARIESNNGGTIFARNIRNQLRIAKNFSTYVEEFSQTMNKESRILNNRDEVNNMIFFPSNWQTRWPIFYAHVTSFRAVGQNAFDDAPDALTGVCEMCRGGGFTSIEVLKSHANR